MKNIEINRQDAINALTETEAAILDVLVTKVQEYTFKRELEETSKNAMIKMFAEKTGIPVTDVKLSELGGGFSMLINELNGSNPFADMMGIPMMEKKDKVDPSIWNVAFDMMFDPKYHEAVEEAEEKKQLINQFSGNPFLLRLLLETFK